MRPRAPAQPCRVDVVGFDVGGWFHGGFPSVSELAADTASADACPVAATGRCGHGPHGSRDAHAAPANGAGRPLTAQASASWQGPGQQDAVSATGCGKMGSARPRVVSCNERRDAGRTRRNPRPPDTGHGQHYAHLSDAHNTLRRRTDDQAVSVECWVGMDDRDLRSTPPFPTGKTLPPAACGREVQI